MKLLLTALAAAAIAMSPALAQMKPQVHNGTGVVTNVDRNAGKVTLKHEPIKSLNWPGMTMAFAVKDKGLLDNVAKDRKIEFEFVQEGKQYVITSVK